jgi:hypothetical protein
LSGDRHTTIGGIHPYTPTQNFDIWQLDPTQIHSATVSFSLFLSSFTLSSHTNTL